MLAMPDASNLYPSHPRSRATIDRIFDLALDNQMLSRIERTLILRMAHIQQGRYAKNQLKALVPGPHQKIFRDYIVNALSSKSSCYRKRALVLTFYLLGNPLPLIAEFLVVSKHAVREFIRRYQEGDVAGLLARPSNKLKIAERQDLRDRLFAVMHEPPRVCRRLFGLSYAAIMCVCSSPA